MKQKSNFKIIRANTVIFPGIGEVDLKKIDDATALKIYLNGHTDFVKLSSGADKSIFANVSTEKLTTLKAKLDKRDLAILKKVLG